MTRTLLAALAATLLAGCAAQGAATSPSLGLDGLASEVTQPTGGFDATFGQALGPDGEVFVVFTRDATQWRDGVDPGEWGLALVYRDGTSDVVVKQGDPMLGDTYVSLAAVSNSTVAWGLLSYDGDRPDTTHTALLFWDRASRRLTTGADSVSVSGSRTSTDPSALDFTLVGDMALWTQYAGGDDGPLWALVAATPDGRAWPPLGTSEEWRTVGLDECASTDAEPVFWVTHTTSEPDGNFALTVDHFTLDDSGLGALVAGDAVVRSLTSDGYAFSIPARCGDDLLGQVWGERELDENGNSYYAITSGDNTAIEPVVAMEQDFMIARTILLGPRWIVLVLDGKDSVNTAHIINRDTGDRHDIVGGPFCGNVSLQGEYVMWQEPREPQPGDAQLPGFLTCETHVGVMTR